MRCISAGGSGLPHMELAQLEALLEERSDSESERLRSGEICTCFSICKEWRKRGRMGISCGCLSQRRIILVELVQMNLSTLNTLYEMMIQMNSFKHILSISLVNIYVIMN